MEDRLDGMLHSQCSHDRGADCDHVFHYCRGCGVPLDDCDCAALAGRSE